MQSKNTADTCEALLALAWIAGEALLTMLVMLTALVLALSGWRPKPSPRPVMAGPQPGAADSPDRLMTPAPWAPALPGLDAVPVAQLRRLARERGLPRCLSAHGRRADLLLALPMAW